MRPLLFTFESDQCIIEVVSKLKTSALLGANIEIQEKNRHEPGKKLLSLIHLTKSAWSEVELKEPLETYRVINTTWK